MSSLPHLKLSPGSTRSGNRLPRPTPLPGGFLRQPPIKQPREHNHSDLHEEDASI